MKKGLKIAIDARCFAYVDEDIEKMNLAFFDEAHMMLAHLTAAGVKIEVLWGQSDTCEIPGVAMLDFRLLYDWCKKRGHVAFVSCSMAAENVSTGDYDVYVRPASKDSFVMVNPKNGNIIMQPGVDDKGAQWHWLRAGVLKLLTQGAPDATYVHTPPSV